MYHPGSNTVTARLRLGSYSLAEVANLLTQVAVAGTGWPNEQLPIV